MEWPLFAYTGQMKIILFFFASFYGFLYSLFLSNFVLLIYGENINTNKKIIFSFFSGTVLYVWIFYFFALFKGSILSPIILFFLRYPNPISILLWWILAIKILNVSPKRSIVLMKNYCVYSIFNTAVIKLFTFTYFQQYTQPYNYLLDFFKVLVQIVVITLIYFISNRYIKKTKVLISLPDYIYIKPLPVEIAKYFIKTSLIYLLCVYISFKTDSNIYGIMIIILFSGLLLILFLVYDYRTALKIDNDNKSAYIATLLKSIEQFDGIRHDFNNILQTYGGYIQLGDIDRLKKYHTKNVALINMSASDLDLSKILNQNPPLVSLLVNKLDLAQLKDVTIRFNISCKLDDFNLSDILLCRVVANLLDNAIDEAYYTRNKMVFVTMEDKKQSKLLVILNSIRDNVSIEKITASGYTTKEGHQGLGLTNVRKILGENAGCSLNISTINEEFIVYVEIPKKFL